MKQTFGATPPSQEASPANNVTSKSEDWESKTLSSYLDPELAQQDPEASGYGLNLPQEAIPNDRFAGEDCNTWHFVANTWTASGNVTSNDFYPLPTRNPATSSWSPSIYMQNNVYGVPSLASHMSEPWNATLDIPRHSPHRMQEALAGLLPGVFQDEYNAHGTVQEYNNGSEISSLSSSYIYNSLEPQGPPAGHELPAPVPWSRPNTLVEDNFGSMPWMQSPTLPDQLENVAVSEQAISGTHFALALGPVESDRSLEKTSTYLIPSSTN